MKHVKVRCADEADRGVWGDEGGETNEEHEAGCTNQQFVNGALLAINLPYTDVAPTVLVPYRI